MIVSGAWKPFKFGRNHGPKISNLFFADNIILVAEASQKQLDIVRQTLDRFCSFSGQKFNLSKSAVCFNGNVSSAVADSLSSPMGGPITGNIGKYLLVPMHHRVFK